MKSYEFECLSFLLSITIINDILGLRNVSDIVKILGIVDNISEVVHEELTSSNA